MPQLSILIVSYNTKDVLKECLESIIEESINLSHEIIIVDNASKDGSAEMVAQLFPEVNLIKSPKNLGFGAANNLAYKYSKGDYILLLNSDAFIHSGCLKVALDGIKSSSKIGMGGARLVGPDGSWQPSARLFPSLLTEIFQLSGLESKYPKSKLFGRFNRTWDKWENPCETDWVPGAFAIIPRKVIEKVGFFDEKFFLYSEEVDLCNRIKKAGFTIQYWPNVVVTHIGGESSKNLNQSLGIKSRKLDLWNFRSQIIYYRKYHGFLYTLTFYFFQRLWHGLRMLKNFEHPEKMEESKIKFNVLKQAWLDTQGGLISPPRPW